METLVIAAVLVATCLTINAQGAKFDNSELNGKSPAMAESSNKIPSVSAEAETETTLAAFAAYLAEEKESELKTEDWMLNVDNFYMDIQLEEAIENPLEVEEWMLNGKLFESNAKAEMNVDETTENTVKAEPRKKAVGITFQGTQFGRRSFILIEEDDSKLEMEPWMLSYKYFDKK